MPVDLGGYLRQRGSPLADHVDAIYRSANRYRVDPRLIVAIAGGETSFGKAGGGPKNFNAWGIGPGIRYGSWAEGIDAAAKLLRSGYVGKGLTSIPKIQQKWAPIAASNDPTGLNNNWVRNMSQFYSDLGGNPNNVVAGWRKASAPGSKQRTGPKPVPSSIQPQTGQPLKMTGPTPEQLQAQLFPNIESPVDVAASNLADIAAGKSALSGLHRLSSARSEFAQMVEATETLAASMRTLSPNGNQSTVKPTGIDKGGTYTTTPTKEVAGDDKVQRAIQIAKKQIGTPYVWGGTKPGGFDCSGLIEYAFEQAGIPTPGRLTTWSAVKMGKSIRQGAMKPGDWLITNKGKHMVMYVGGGQVIAAPRSGTNVQLQPVSRFKGDIVDIRRVR